MKDLWKDKDRRRGAIVSVVIHVLLLLVFLFFGLKYYEPKPEDGIVINFGDSATGIGDEADGTPQPQQEELPPETTPERTEAETPTEETQDPTQTQDVVDAPSLDEESTEKETQEEEEEEPTPEELEQQRIEREEAEKARELEERFGKVSESEAGGEGEKEGPGDQGDPSGDPDSPNRSGGAGGGGGGGNYLLGNRQALYKAKPEYQCEGEGRVVVKIYVNREGKVTRAVPGEKVPEGPASTTASSCLYDKARAAAVRTTWQPASSDDPDTQTGYIIYNFQKR